MRLAYAPALAALDTTGRASSHPRAVGLWRGHPAAYVLDGEVPHFILAGLLAAASREGQALGGLVSEAYRDWVRHVIRPLIFEDYRPAYALLRLSDHKLTTLGSSPGIGPRTGCAGLERDRCDSEFATGTVHWNVTTCLSNHVGGEGSLMIYDASQLADRGAAYGPVARAPMASAERVVLASVVARTIVMRSDYVHETLPTSTPWSTVSTCVATAGDTGAWSRL